MWLIADRWWLGVPHPLSSVLYPDLAPLGSLAAALRDLARREGVDLGSIETDQENRSPTSAALHRGRRTVTITLGSQERWLIAECWQRGAVLASGKTPDVWAMLGAAQAFLHEVSLADLHAQFPFLGVSDLGLAFEAGTEVTVKWQIYVAHPDEDVRALAARAAPNPSLRSLFPFTSHRSLRFSRCTGYPYTWDLPFIVPLGAGRYRVHFQGEEVLADNVDAASAVAAVIAALPPGSGPAVPGTAEDLDQ